MWASVLFLQSIAGVCNIKNCLLQCILQGLMDYLGSTLVLARKQSTFDGSDSQGGFSRVEAYYTLNYGPSYDSSTDLKSNRADTI